MTGARPSMVRPDETTAPVGQDGAARHLDAIAVPQPTGRYRP